MRDLNRIKIAFQGCVGLLREPRFTYKTAKEFCDLSYRKLNDWDDKHLISPYRITSKRGWRKFSFVELIELSIIVDLKKVGFGNTRVRKIIRKISQYRLRKRNQSDFFEMLIFWSLIGKRFLVAVFEDGKVSFFPETRKYTWAHAIDRLENSLVSILPFRSYVQRIYRECLQNVAYPSNSPESRLKTLVEEAAAAFQGMNQS